MKLPSFLIFTHPKQSSLSCGKPSRPACQPGLMRRNLSHLWCSTTPSARLQRLAHL